jgi:hypothetical protein
VAIGLLAVLRRWRVSPATGVTLVPRGVIGRRGDSDLSPASPPREAPQPIIKDKQWVVKPVKRPGAKPEKKGEARFFFAGSPRSAT